MSECVVEQEGITRHIRPRVEKVSKVQSVEEDTRSCWHATVICEGEWEMGWARQVFFILKVFYFKSVLF